MLKSLKSGKLNNYLMFTIYFVFWKLSGPETNLNKSLCLADKLQEDY